MKFNIIFIIFFINSLSISAATNANEHKQKIINYIINIDEFSSKFIQSDGHTIEEGNFYIKKNRLKIVYTYPSRIELIIAKNKAMYFNKDLKEVEYFNPKKTMADIFFRVFNDELFFDKANIESKTNYLVLKQTISLDEKKIYVEIIFENSPLIIRKINIKNEESKSTYSIVDPNFNPNLDSNFFSMAAPIL